MTEFRLTAQDIVRVLADAGLLCAHQMGDLEQIFTSYTTDSRQVDNQGLFIAYKGVKYDPHTAIDALNKRAATIGFVTENPNSFANLSPTSFACLVKDSREAWAYLAAFRYGNPERKLKLIGVTGTNGKTSTVWFVRQLLRAIHKPCLVFGTIGVYLGDEKFPSTHTTPDPDELFRLLALGVSKGAGYAAMEVSSHAVVQKRLGPLRFDALAFTSFSRDHLDFHASMEEYFAAKWYIVSELLRPGAAVWLSTSLGNWLPEQASNYRFYGEERVGATMRTQDACFAIESMSLRETAVSIHSGASSWRGKLSFGADFAVANFVAALLIVDGLFPQALHNLPWAAVEPVPGRFEPIPTQLASDPSVIIDYAHTPDALEQTLRKLRDLTSGKLWVVFGCGGDRDRGKRPLMGAIAEEIADHVIITSDNPRSEEPAVIIREIAAGMKKGHHTSIVDRELAIKHAIKLAQDGDSILIAGKGHETYQIIGTTILEFDDRAHAEKLLRSLRTKDEH